MSSQIFKTPIPNDIFINFLEEIALKNNNNNNNNNNKYIINTICYKKGMYNGIIEKFIESCKPYYYLSKRKYLERKLTYSSFITIIRQICNYNKITYTSQIKYDKSSYEIIYYIQGNIPYDNSNDNNNS
jgi:hypothetical protein